MIRAPRSHEACFLKYSVVLYSKMSHTSAPVHCHSNKLHSSTVPFIHHESSPRRTQDHLYREVYQSLLHMRIELCPLYQKLASATLRLALRGVKFLPSFFSFLDIFFENLLFCGKGHHYWSWDSKRSGCTNNGRLPGRVNQSLNEQ